MADDRPADDSLDQLAKLQADFEDFRTTALARMARCATGTVEIALLTGAKADTLMLDGQTVSRTTYANLWQWAQDQSLVVAGMFTTGDGSTTFGLPDYRGRFLVNTGALSPDTYTVGGTGGASLKTLTTANMPAHNHTGSTDSYNHGHGSAGGHSHGGGSSGGGGHGGHNSGSFGVQGGGDGAVSSNGNTFNGDHSHSMSIDYNGDHSHSSDNHSHNITMNNTGSGTAVDARPAFKAVNLLIWT